MKPWVALLLALPLLCGAGIVHADHSACYYDPRTMVGFGCNSVDFQMIELKHALLAADRSGDDEAFWAIRDRTLDLERTNGDTYLVSEAAEAPEPLHVHAFRPLQHYQVADSAEVGENIRYATLPGDANERPRLAYWDRLGRPMKVAGMFHTTSAGHAVNEALSYGWGVVGGWAVGELPVTATVARWVGVQMPAWAGAIGDGYLTSEALGHIATMPEAGDTNLLVDVLTLEGGRHVVYRNWVTVGGAGQITAHKMASGSYWQRLGPVEYDEDGQPVW